MQERYLLALILAIIGFFISLLLSIFAGSSFSTVLFRSLLSAILLGGLGFTLVYLLNKFVGNIGPENSYTSKEVNKNVNKNVNKDEDVVIEEGQNFSTSNLDKNKNLSNATIISDEEEPISYEKLFAKLNEDETDIGKEIKEEKESNPTKLKDFLSKKSGDSSKNQEFYKSSIIEEMNEEKKKEQININILADSDIVEGDTEFNRNSISAEEAAKICATSKMPSISGEIKGIDDKYIYFSKGSKIENKPEKIAKVIKEMLKNE